MTDETGHSEGLSRRCCKFTRGREMWFFGDGFGAKIFWQQSNGVIISLLRFIVVCHAQ